MYPIYEIIEEQEKKYGDYWKVSVLLHCISLFYLFSSSNLGGETNKISTVMTVTLWTMQSFIPFQSSKVEFTISISSKWYMLFSQLAGYNVILMLTKIVIMFMRRCMVSTFYHTHFCHLHSSDLSNPTANTS